MPDKASLSVRMPERLLGGSTNLNGCYCGAAWLCRELVGPLPHKDATAWVMDSLEGLGFERESIRTLMIQNDSASTNEARLGVFRGFCEIHGIEVRDE